MLKKQSGDFSVGAGDMVNLWNGRMVTVNKVLDEGKAFDRWAKDKDGNAVLIRHQMNEVRSIVKKKVL